MKGRILKHSGGEWECLGTGLNGGSVWPIDEFFSRSPYLTAGMIRDLEAANPDGKEEGENPAGWSDEMQAAKEWWLLMEANKLVREIHPAEVRDDARRVGLAEKMVLWLLTKFVGDWKPNE